MYSQQFREFWRTIQLFNGIPCKNVLLGTIIKYPYCAPSSDDRSVLPPTPTISTRQLLVCLWAALLHGLYGIAPISLPPLRLIYARPRTQLCSSCSAAFSPTDVSACVCLATLCSSSPASRQPCDEGERHLCRVCLMSDTHWSDHIEAQSQT